MKRGGGDISNQELLNVISKGFSAMENRFDELEMKVSENSRDIRALTNRFDNEILRRTDQHADHEKRITEVEEHLEL